MISFVLGLVSSACSNNRLQTCARCSHQCGCLTLLLTLRKPRLKAMNTPWKWAGGLLLRKTGSHLLKKGDNPIDILPVMSSTWYAGIRRITFRKGPELQYNHQKKCSKISVGFSDTTLTSRLKFWLKGCFMLWFSRCFSAALCVCTTFCTSLMKLFFF